MKKVGIVFVILVIVVFGAFLGMTNSAKKNLKEMVYEDINMNRVKDGIYEGEADADLVFVRAEVTVKNSSINKIDIIEHRNGLGAKAEAITEEMIAKNSYEVDSISGATLSSETIKSAVSKALKEGYSK